MSEEGRKGWERDERNKAFGTNKRTDERARHGYIITLLLTYAHLFITSILGHSNWAEFFSYFWAETGFPI